MDKLKWVNWSEAIREDLLKKQKIEELHKKFESKIKVSDKVAKEFTDKISKSVTKRFREAK